MASLRGQRIAMVLQNPMGMFDPLVRVGSQVVEGVVLRRLLTREQARDRALELLASMGFDNPLAILGLYPHQLSGGMSQRVAIAMAMMPFPSVIVADEPTTALDANLRLEVLDLLKSVATRTGSAVVMVSHDLGLLSHFCDSISVMYAGRIVEQGAISDVLAEPEHPYTAALLRCSPSLSNIPRQPLPVIAGALPVSGFWPAACVFEPRCALAFERCRTERPLLRRSGSRAAACHLAFDEKG
jgi:oligopeptide/dipeptide ABC transporter ATP-binding protein